MYYRCSENKGVDLLRSNCIADLHLCFRIGKNPVFSCSDSSVIMTLFQAPFGRNSLKLIVEGDDNVQNYFNLDLTNGNVTVRQSLVQQSEPYYKVYNIPHSMSSQYFMYKFQVFVQLESGILTHNKPFTYTLVVKCASLLVRKMNLKLVNNLERGNLCHFEYINIHDSKSVQEIS